MKQIALIVMLSVVGFVVALVVLIADRLSAEEVALLAGVVCGVGAAMPLGMLAGAALAGRRRDRSVAALPALYITQPSQPTLIGSQPGGSRLPQAQATSAAVRGLNIIGQNAFDADGFSDLNGIIVT